MKTVTHFGWSVSTTSGHGINGAILHVTKQKNGKDQCGELNGKQFPSSDAAFAAAKERGYTRQYFSRPTTFIHLRLSRATRKFLNVKPELERWVWVVENILERSERSSNYRRAISGSSHMALTRANWMAYLNGQNPERRTK